MELLLLLLFKFLKEILELGRNYVSHYFNTKKEIAVCKLLFDFNIWVSYRDILI